MKLFIRATFVTAAAIVAFAALLLIVKLLVVAGLVAATVIGITFALRSVRGGGRERRLQRAVVVTTLTAGD